MIDPSTGSPANIGVRQNDHDVLDGIAAYSLRYRTAARWRRLRTVGTYVLALLAPALSYLFPQQGPLVAAVAATWLVAGRTLLTHIERSYSTRGAVLQELVDTELFQLPWNSALAGRQTRALEDRAADAPYRHEDRHRNWYTIDDAVPHPAHILLCQLQNVAWGRRNHRDYVPFLATAGAALFVLDLVWSIEQRMSVYDFLVLLFLPSAPAFLDLGELIFSHRRHSEAKGRVEDDTRDLLDRLIAGQPVPLDDCRRIQDAIYQSRCTVPRVPGWFYRTKRQRDMKVNDATVEHLQDRLLGA